MPGEVIFAACRPNCQALWHNGDVRGKYSAMRVVAADTTGVVELCFFLVTGFGKSYWAERIDRRQSSPNEGGKMTATTSGIFVSTSEVTGVRCCRSSLIILD